MGWLADQNHAEAGGKGSSLWGPSEGASVALLKPLFHSCKRRELRGPRAGSTRWATPWWPTRRAVVREAGSPRSIPESKAILWGEMPAEFWWWQAGFEGHRRNAQAGKVVEADEGKVGHPVGAWRFDRGDPREAWREGPRADRCPPAARFDLSEVSGHQRPCRCPLDGCGMGL